RSNMRQLTLAILAYADENDYYFPWPGDSNSNRDPDWVWGGETSSTLSTPSAWGMPDFGFRAEAGSVYSYVTMSPRVPRTDYDKSKLNNRDRKSTRLNSSHVAISYAVFCLKKKKFFS